jgi:hypothetical protein
VDGWQNTVPAGDDDTAAIVEDAWDHGTFGKMLVEHAAVRVAAKEDLARVLRDSGHRDLAAQFIAHLPQVRALLDRLDEHARGVAPISLAGSEDFAAAVADLAAVIQADLAAEADEQLPRIAAALGPRRRQLRSARYVSVHAPTHPGAARRWYDNIPILVRLHAGYDHLRGWPWAKGPLGDARVARRVERDS